VIAAQRAARRCATLFAVDLPELLGRRRHHHLAKARFALYAALAHRGWSQQQIGEALGRDRSTIRNGLLRARRYYDRDRHFRQSVDDIAGWLTPPAPARTPVTAAVVVAFMSSLIGKQPRYIIQTAPTHDRSDVLLSLSALIASEMERPVAEIAEATERTPKWVERMVADIKARAEREGWVGDLLDRARQHFLA
jgi:hypothetical protein